MSDYLTVYQISAAQSTKWGPEGVGPVLLFIGCILLVGAWRFRWRQLHWGFPACLCWFGLLFILIERSERQNQFGAFAAFQMGEYSVVEGVVTDFHPMPYEGHDNECFSVQAHRFCYSDYVVAPGFHNAASHGGPMRSGLRVRIAYSGPTIFRIEIAMRGEVHSPTASNQ